MFVTVKRLRRSNFIERIYDDDDEYKVLTRSSFTPGSFFRSSKNDVKNSDLSTWRGATHSVSISAPETDSTFNSHSTIPKINSAFHPSVVGRSSKRPVWLGLRWGTFTCVERQVALCDHIQLVILRSSEMSYHKELCKSFNLFNLLSVTASSMLFVCIRVTAVWQTFANRAETPRASNA